jgi:hypothetical protein
MAVNVTKTKSIKTGYTMMSSPLTFTAADTLSADDTLTIVINNPQKSMQHVTFTVALVQVTVTPSVVITAYGKVTSTSAWVAIGSAITWTTVGNNGSITSTTPANYNYYKIEFVASSASQLSKVTLFEVKTANCYDIPANSGTLTISRATAGSVTVTSKDDDAAATSTVYRAGSTGQVVFGSTDGTTAISSSDWTISTTGVMAGIGNIASNGSVVLSGATSGGITITPIATGTAVTTIQNQNVSAATITLPSATCTLGGLGLNNAYTGTNTFTGGVILATQPTSYWAAGGAVALATSGTDVSCSNGGRWWVELNIPYNSTLTGIAYLIGSTGGTDSVVIQLLNSSGIQVATTRAPGGVAALVGTTATFQSVAFTTPYAAVAGKYYVCLQFNGTTAKFRTYPIPGSRFVANGTTGTWGTAANPTVGTTFVADKGPIICTY